MKELSLHKLYFIKEKMEEENLTNDKIYLKLCERISQKERIMEDGGAGTSTTGGPSTGGMGDVVNSQPSGLAGATIGTNWSNHGGLSGSGDVSVGFNAGTGGKNLHQKIPVMGFNHGSRTGKKSRTKKLDLKALKNVFAKNQDYTAGEGEVKKSKVMSFDDFLKNDFTTVKK